MPHELGMKSRCRLVGMMMKRSSHMPTLTNMQTMKSGIIFVRNVLNQSSCGTTPLQMIRNQ